MAGNICSGDGLCPCASCTKMRRERLSAKIEVLNFLLSEYVRIMSFGVYKHIEDLKSELEKQYEK